MQFFHKDFNHEAIDKHEEWEQCNRCSLCETRYKGVLWRGYLPCEVLFIGEAPGSFEDLQGLPFVGPAGSFLDIIIRGVNRELDEEYDLSKVNINTHFLFAISNLVACVPKEGSQTREPKQSEIDACSERLDEFIKISEPKIIVRLGKLSQKNVSKDDVSILNMIHPSAIAQTDRSARAPLIHKAITDLFCTILRVRKYDH